MEVSLALMGMVLVALGALHLWITDRFFAFYARFNEGKGPFQLPGGRPKERHAFLAQA